ncbi:MAG TPA: TlpA disulfide reductase family protein [Candidatus Dormibacteraeota bacterium]|nr:TlpA disulfide reductase family protein [Candidatus Dormibacteraeota bacterium]
MAIVAVVAAAAVMLGFYTFRHSLSAGPESLKHRPAPDFTLPLIDGGQGGQLRLSSYRGKVVLLDFWATWCVPCRDETPHFVELQRKYGGQGLQIIGVSMDDSPDPVRTFYQQFHINYPVVMGTAETGSAYGGVLGLPIAFLIDRDGRIYAKHMGATDAAVFEKDITALL